MNVLYLLAMILSLMTGSCILVLSLLIQFAIDSALVEANVEQLAMLTGMSGLIFLVKFALEWVLAVVNTKLSPQKGSLIALELCVQLPRIVLGLIFIFSYVWVLGVLTSTLTCVSGIIYALVGQWGNRKPLPMIGIVFSSLEVPHGIFARFLLYLSTLCFFYFGFQFVIQNQLITLGQVIAFILIHFQVSGFVLSLVNILLYQRKREVLHVI